ncbi:MAG: ABC transporter ATP-binding protein [Clostridiales bacterium]|nr:ABC transporter ATP-binding protein [Clostridiales bacterium]
MLQLVHVQKSYKQHKVIDDLSFTIQRGEIVGFIGPNGAGKSTTVSMIATLVRPDSGEILFHGEDIVKHPNRIRRCLGFVPQDIALYESLTGYDNLRFWAEAYHVESKFVKERIEKICEMIDFNDDLLKKKVKEYSGGMKRRLNIGVALLHQPELVILDEPTVGIDIQSRKQILNAIQLLRKEGTTIIYIGHYMEEVSNLCDRVIMMSHGKCILDAALPDALTVNNKTFTLEELYENLNCN